MAGKLVVIHPNGTLDEVEYAGREPEIETLQKLVGGWVEQIPAMVRYGGRLCRCYADEEGLLKGYPHNHTASRLVRQAFQIVGPMVIEVPAYGHAATPRVSRAALKTPLQPHELEKQRK